MMAAPRILVAYASRHHGTEGIAREIAAALGAAGFRVDLRNAGVVVSVARYAAIVIGSSVYMARWEDSALGLLRRERTTLARRPVWLFSSGPVGNGKTTRRPEMVPHPEAVVELADEIGVRGSAMFGGRVAADEPGFDIEVMAQAGLTGDWRDLGRVRAWSHAIAIAIRSELDGICDLAAGPAGHGHPDVTRMPDIASGAPPAPEIAPTTGRQ
jgi:menaquinone-dependent protoporphyrinogen oxidase